MLLFNANLPNYTSVMPLYELLGNFTEEDKINLARDIFNEIDKNGTAIVEYNHPRKGFKIGVYLLDDYVYLFQSIKSTNTFFKNNLYVATLPHKDDFMKIAKYLEDLYYGSSKNKIKTRQN